MSLTIIIGLGAVSRRGEWTDEQGIIYVFFERGDQHQICGGSSKCSLSIFFGEPAEHECRGKSWGDRETETGENVIFLRILPDQIMDQQKGA